MKLIPCKVCGAGCYSSTGTTTKMTTTSDRKPASPYGVICPDCGKQGLTKEEYMQQMAKPDSFWTCPICKDVATWDDDRYEDVFYMPDGQ